MTHGWHWILFWWLGVTATNTCDWTLLNSAINALDLSLSFMEHEVKNINLDAVAGIRMVDDQLNFILDSMPVSLKRDLKFIPIFARLLSLQTRAFMGAERAIPYIEENDPNYFKAMGSITRRKQWNLRYPVRSLPEKSPIEPLRCQDIPFNETTSDECIMQLLGTNPKTTGICHVGDDCLELMTYPGFKGYALTHQVLYLQVAEMNGCLPVIVNKLNKEIGTLQDNLCVNILRDAQFIASQGYPNRDQDLFMEQIAFCGMLGYADIFHSPWLKNIIEWQQPNGCYTRKVDNSWHCNDNDTQHDKIREKREEKKLEGGCLSHKTAVAIIALTTNVRFCIENLSYSLDQEK